MLPARVKPTQGKRAGQLKWRFNAALMEFARELVLAGLRSGAPHTGTLHFYVLYGEFHRKGALVADGLLRYFSTVPCAEVRPSAPALFRSQKSVRAVCRIGAVRTDDRPKKFLEIQIA